MSALDLAVTCKNPNIFAHRNPFHGHRIRIDGFDKPTPTICDECGWRDVYDLAEILRVSGA
jgi:hypothetical protein